MKKMMRLLAAIGLSASALVAHAGELEVLHWWTSGGEAKSVAILKEMLEQQGYHWKDFAVAGGGGESAMTVLKTRAVSGNPPAAAQIKGHDIQEWAALGFLANLDQVAQEENWEAIVPSVVTDIMQYKGHYVAVPVNVHRTNWLWANPKVFEQAEATIPHTLEEFFEAAEKIQAAGFIPLAHGGQAWQDTALFEAVTLNILGAEDYYRAFVEHDMVTLKSPKMVEAFRQFKRMKQYIDRDSRGREWNVATNMVIRGEAAMQIMGDWVKGEFTAAGKQPGEDYICVPTPGTKGQFTFNIDSFVMFELKDPEKVQAQYALAHTIMDPLFQRQFNLSKGSIPVRTDMPMTQFDQCALESMRAFKASAESGSLVPSVAHGMATTSYVQGAIFDVVTNFFNDDAQTPEQAANKLARAIKAAN